MEDTSDIKGNDIKSVLKEFIKNNYLYAINIDQIKDDTSFLDTGIINSNGILELIYFLEESFDIVIENDEVIPENLDSFNNIQNFINKKRMK